MRALRAVVLGDGVDAVALLEMLSRRASHVVLDGLRRIGGLRARDRGSQSYGGGESCCGENTVHGSDLHCCGPRIEANDIRFDRRSWRVTAGPRYSRPSGRPLRSIQTAACQPVIPHQVPAPFTTCWYCRGFSPVALCLAFVTLIAAFRRNVGSSSSLSRVGTWHGGAPHSRVRKAPTTKARSPPVCKAR